MLHLSDFIVQIMKSLKMHNFITPISNAVLGLPRPLERACLSFTTFIRNELSNLPLTLEKNLIETIADTL